MSSTSRDGIHMEFFGDGSGPAFHLTPLGDLYYGVNERLYANDRREGTDPRTQEPVTPSKESLLINPKARTLCYSRDVGYCDLPFLVIHGDLGRAFTPQPWAAGFLPIIPVERVFAFADGAPRAVLEFTPPRIHNDALVSAASWLLLHGWGNGFVSSSVQTPRGLLAALSAIGIHTDARNLKRTLLLMERMGHVKNTPPRLGWKRSSETTASYWEAVRPSFDEGIYASVQQLRIIWSAFEPFCVVKSKDVTFDPAWWGKVKFQGFVPPVYQQVG